MKRPDTGSPEEMTEEETETLKALLDYPSLENFFDSAAGTDRQVLREKMLSTVDELERVIRRGSGEDAAKAAKAVAAYRTALDFLDELATRRPAG